MIAHCVFLRLSADADLAKLDQVMLGLDALTRSMPGAGPMVYGPNLDLEGKSEEYPYGFVIHFEDGSALAQYGTDPIHKTLGASLVSLCEGGTDGIVVYDLEYGL